MKKGFTLAEVLITLGIIGVVAALTIPTLSKNIQHKILEVRFKQSLSLITQVIQRARIDTDTDSLYDFCCHNNRHDCHFTVMEQIRLLSGSKIVKGSYGLYSNVERGSNAISTYNGKSVVDLKGGAALYGLYYTNSMKNGSFLNAYFVDARNGLWFYVDTNGDDKPNMLGHDVFLFKIFDSRDVVSEAETPNNDMTDEQAIAYANSQSANQAYYTAVTGTPCSLTSTRGGNGLGCAYYALKNKCPYDDTKTYWECLP